MYFTEKDQLAGEAQKDKVTEKWGQNWSGNRATPPLIVFAKFI